MTPTHHPPEEWLLAHASGVATEGIDLLVASHATLCPACRERLDELVEVAGLYMSDVPMQPVPGIDALLAALPEQDAPPQAPAPASHGLPAPLTPYVGSDALEWKFVAPGVSRVDLGFDEGEMPVRLLSLRGGLKIPTHNHPGLERTLVLQGGYDDESGTFVRGDIGIRDGSEPHYQVIHRGEPCIALVVADHPITPVGLKSRVLSWFFSA